MKKFSIFAVAATALVMASCNDAVKPSLVDDVDTLAYDLGMAQADGLKQYMTMQLGVDSTCLDDFIKGMKEGALRGEESKAEEAYRKGLDVGAQVKQMAEGLSKEVYADDSTKSVNVANILAGLIEGLKGEATMTSDSAYAEFNKRLEPIRQAALERTYADAKAANEKYLEENKKKDGVVTLPSGLQYKVLVEGDGAMPTDTTKVKCNYEGKLIDGTVFDSSLTEGRSPLEVDLAQPRVIQGWVEALKLMPAGSKWEVVIPQELGYGSQDMGQIKPFSTLIFTIEVLK